MATVFEIQPGALLKPEAAEIVSHLLESVAVLFIMNAEGRPATLLGRNAEKATAPLPCRLAG